jgi:hypothetical protein
MKKLIIKEYSIKITETHEGIEEHIKHDFKNLYELLGILEIEVMRVKDELSKSRED